MCGIVACYAWDAPAWPERLLQRMNSLQASRGPDNLQHCLLLDGRLGLAHARLAILDLDPRSNQPMASPDGRRHLVFNGELYNYLELRQTLQAAGFVFRTTSDTEVLLHALTHWGPAALPRLEGMFAFVYADLAAGRLLAARDRLGIKPLAWLQLPGRIAFASTITPLTLLPGFDRTLDPLARLELLATKCVPAPRSIYAQIRKLLPGHCLEVAFDGTVRERCWWSLAEWLPEPEQLSQRGPCPEQALEAVLEQSVARQLVADVPVGVFLSGGLDSSLVAALAARHVRTRGGGAIKTFSVGFTVPELNEAPYARAIAEHLGAEHHEIMVSPRELQDTFPAVAAMYDEPFGDASAVPTYLMSRFARQHVTVALSGDGGDEQFFGYGRYHHLARLLPWVGRIPGWLRRLARWRPPTGPRSRMDNWRLGLLGYRDLSTLYVQYVFDWYAHLAAMVGAGSVARFHEASRAMETGRQAHALARGDVRRAMMLADLLHYLPDDCLTKVDRASMACSLEVRPPLLDELTLRQSLALPLGCSWQDGQGKAALREMLARHLPRQLFERPKMGFGVPLKDWLFGELREMTESLLNTNSCLAMGLDPAAVAGIARQHRQGLQDHQYFLWTCCCLGAWVRQTTAPPCTE